MGRDWPKFLWREAATPVAVAVLLLLYWTGAWRTLLGVDLALILALLGGWRIYYDAISKLLRLRLSADLAVALAAIAAIGIGEYLAAAEVILIMLIGEALEEFAVARSHDALRALSSAVPRQARLRDVDGAEREVPVEDVRVGQTVLVRPGERVPLDGEVIAGSSAVDQSTLTGESLPVTKRAGDAVFAGTMNGVGRLEVRVTAAAGETTLDTMVRLVAEAEAKRAPIERRADRYAAYFVPGVLLAALATYLVTRNPMSAIAVMVIACPCGLVLATPAAVAAGIGRLALDGVLVKSGAALEAAGRADCVVLDKTGTLTRGEPALAAVVAAAGLTEDDVLRLAAIAEGHSEHALGALVRREAERRGLTPAGADEFQAEPGLGVVASAAGSRIVVGSEALMARSGVSVPAELDAERRRLEAEGRTVVLVGRDERAVGLLAAEDPIRPQALSLGQRLRDSGATSIVVLTGDNERAARRVADQLGLAAVAANLLPDEKVAHVRRLQADGHRVLMVGDGVNDAPSLAAADVGVAMGGIGTDIATEAADIVLMADDLARLPHLIAFARRTQQTIRENILYFAVLFNAVAVGAAAVGVVKPVAAAVVHQASSLLVVGNSLFLLVLGRLGETWLGQLWALLSTALAPWARHLAPSRVRSQVATAWGARAGVARWALLLIALLYAWWGVYTVRPEEAAVRRLFGRATGAPTGPGLHYWPPPPIGRVDRVPAARVRAIEVGFRTRPGGQTIAPAAYEWSFQHRTGGYEKIAEESTMVTGDGNLVSVTAVVQYRIADPEAFLLAARDPDAIVRVAAESAFREVVNTVPLAGILTTGRGEVGRAVAGSTRARLEPLGCGVEVVRVALQDVHPPVEVVSAFRDVITAREERDKRINQAEGYRNERVPKAAGEAARDVKAAQAYATERTERATGEAGRFRRQADAYRLGRGVTRTRLYLSAIESALAEPQKLILDSRSTRARQMLFVEQGALRLAVPEQPAASGEGAATEEAPPASPQNQPEASP